MSIRLKKILRANPLDRRCFQWYLSQQKTGFVGIEEIAHEISTRSALSSGDVQSVLSNLVEVIPLFLKLGNSIRIRGFGSFHIGITSEGKDDADKLDSRHVKAARLRFVPARRLKQLLATVSYKIEDLNSPE